MRCQPLGVTPVQRLFDQLAAGADHGQLNELRAGMVVGAEGDAIAAEVLVQPFQGGNQLFPTEFLATCLADRLDSQLGDDEASMLI